MSSKKYLPKLKPCPFCGSTSIRAGVASACSQEVSCVKCRACIELDNVVPKGLINTDFEEWSKRVDRYTLGLCIKAWNKRKEI